MNIAILAFDLNQDLSFWGMTTLERLLWSLNTGEQKFITVFSEQKPTVSERFFRKNKNNVVFRSDESGVGHSLSEVSRQTDDSVVILNANLVYDPRSLTKILAATPDSIVVDPRHDNAFGAKLSTETLSTTVSKDVEVFEDIFPILQEFSGIEMTDVTTLPTRIDSVKKNIIPFVMTTKDIPSYKKAKALLFEMQYKGIMDFMYMYLYRPVVKLSAGVLSKCNITPNTVSLVNIFLSLSAVPLFLFEYLGTALLLTLLTVILDSIDGLLARLTFNTSKLGHYLDKVAHPVYHCLWLLSLGMALSRQTGDHLPLVNALILIGLFFTTRLVRFIFKRIYGFSLYNLTPFHNWFRNISGNKWNINLVFFTIGFILDRFTLFFFIATGWNAFCVFFYVMTFFIFFVVNRRKTAS